MLMKQTQWIKTITSYADVCIWRKYLVKSIMFSNLTAWSMKMAQCESRLVASAIFSPLFKSFTFARAEMQALQENLSWHIISSVKVVSCIDLTLMFHLTATGSYKLTYFLHYSLKLLWNFCLVISRVQLSSTRGLAREHCVPLSTKF